MATIKLDNIAATASITLQLVKDYSMYDSEIISSNGTIFQSTDTNTVLSLRIYKGVEDITNKITDIEWTRFYFNGDELEEDFTWGKDKNNKRKVVLYKDEMEEKSIIQASGYSMIEGKRELVTTARLTMIKISDVYVSDVEPTSPADKMMWMDTNKTPPLLKIWNDKLKAWESSGTDIPIIKNLIRNSNFWTDIDGYYNIINESIVDTAIIIYQNKKWLSLKSNKNNSFGGVSQDIQYPITKNSNYMFSFIAYKETSGGSAGSNINIKIIETLEDNTVKETVNINKVLSTSISTIEVPFTTSEEVKTITISLNTESGRRSSFFVTELSLYNTSVYYPWELCPEDVGKQITNKIDNDRLSVFNTLMNNNSYKAIYESNSQYYIRSEYITPAVASAEELTNVNNALNQSITNTSNTLNQNITNVNNTLNKSISDVSDDLNKKITNVNNTLNQSIANVSNDLSTKYNELLGKYNELNRQFNSLSYSYTALSETVDDLVSRIEKLEKK